MSEREREPEHEPEHAPESIGEAVVESVPEEIRDAGARGVGRIKRAYQHAHPFVKVAVLGGAFVGGALLVGRIFGPRVARTLGAQGGEGFARGYAQAQASLKRLERGSRFGG